MDFIWSIFSEKYATMFTVIAIIVGPIAAVIITRVFDGYREKRRRRWEVFRSLMRSRGQQLSEDFVGSINLIGVEFHDCSDIIDAKVEYLAHLCSDFPTEEPAKSNFFTEGERKYAVLMQRVAKRLGVDIDGLDIAKGVYSPVGWAEKENELTRIRKLAVEVLNGDIVLPVKVTDYTDVNTRETSEPLSNEQKVYAIKRLLNGDDLEKISSDTRVPIYMLKRWGDQILRILVNS